MCINQAAGSGYHRGSIGHDCPYSSCAILTCSQLPSACDKCQIKELAVTKGIPMELSSVASVASSKEETK